ncbi:alpha/beta hydrolase [Paractinoplanes atraurantiacus]|uniref:Alpha/beta hydrolase n=1 Tax=Paractinoplanes atraurantiacus TaxID=1036182 RepID=A0A285IV01_9ACTN|nr:alpha/beta hydrolase [Actinoplanes atraurantiacus]SNY51870.1 Alpha/beta hydrolase [Actinoplanes atraurantiacus]
MTSDPSRAHEQPQATDPGRTYGQPQATDPGRAHEQPRVADPGVVHARLRVTDPGRWRALALSWRRWADLAGRLAAELTARLVALGRSWTGAAATAATRRLAGLQRRLVLFRLHCWRADQIVSEFAAALERARRLLSRASPADGGAAASTAAMGGAGTGGAGTGGAGGAGAGGVGGAGAGGAGVGGTGAGGAADGPLISGELAAAISVAARADAQAAGALSRLTDGLQTSAAPPGAARPDCTASPAEVRGWWAALPPAQRQWLLVTEPGVLAGLDGVPAADRDVANRLLLDNRRAEIDRAIAGSRGDDRDRLRHVRDGLAALSDRLADGDGPRAYLLRLDLAGEGRAVVALGDPDRAGNVLTHVPGMTADLASFGAELTRAERVATRAAELGPQVASSAVLWLDYDAPDFVDEAARSGQAEAAAPVLRRFQEGLRAGHDGTPGRQTVLGHSYGSLVVGRAATGPGLDADSVVFVGSPGVGVDSANDLRLRTGEVWSSTARDDVIQWAPVAPGGLARDLAVAAAVPFVGPWLAFGRPEDDLWFGHNPSDPGFGARVFPSAPKGHVGYWDPGNPALDTMAAITLGTAR